MTNKELSESELEKILGGIDNNVAKERSLDNEGLFTKQTIEDLKKMKDQLKSYKNEELSEEELDDVKAGFDSRISR